MALLNSELPNLTLLSKGKVRAVQSGEVPYVDVSALVVRKLGAGIVLLTGEICQVDPVLAWTYPNAGWPSRVRL